MDLYCFESRARARPALHPAVHPHPSNACSPRKSVLLDLHTLTVTPAAHPVFRLVWARLLHKHTCTPYVG